MNAQATITLTQLELHRLLRRYAREALTAAGIARPSVEEMAAAAEDTPESFAEARGRLKVHSSVDSITAAKAFVHAVVLDKQQAPLYATAAAYVALVNDADARENSPTWHREMIAAGEALDGACRLYRAKHGLTGNPLGRLREAAMNNWPLPVRGE